MIDLPPRPSVSPPTPAQPAEAPSSSPPADTAPSWHRGLARAARLSDLLAVGVAALLAQATRFSGDLGAASPGGMPYPAISLVVAGLWWLSLGLLDTRSVRILGAGSTEYRGVVNASVLTYIAVTSVSFMVGAQLSRGYVLLLFPVGLLLLLAGRRALRQRLARARCRGERLRRTLLIGAARPVAVLAAAMTSTTSAGYRPVAALLPDGGHPEGLDVPARHGPCTVGQIVRLARDERVETVALAGSDPLSAETVEELSWVLKDHGIGMVLAPSLLGVTPARTLHEPLADLSLIQVTAPDLTGWRSSAKRVFDTVSAAAGLVVLLPLLLVIAAAVRLDSPGPALFAQRRIGRDGVPFTMLKFRSMVVDAEDRLPELMRREDADADGLFKLARDPRVTRVGRFLRRTSLDELPQLLNVVRGEMSLVGPRPPLPHEAARYDARASLRLQVRPGLTGLWQVSGRSDLSWDDAIRLDLLYIQQWSAVQDLLIMLRTVRAVVTQRGAY